jgi:hypothetical protein
VKVWPMFCTQCGQSIDRSDKFCRNCGAPLAQEPFESAATSSQGSPPAPAHSTSAPAMLGVSSTLNMQRPVAAAPARAPEAPAEPENELPKIGSLEWLRQDTAAHGAQERIATHEALVELRSDARVPPAPVVPPDSARELDQLPVEEPLTPPPVTVVPIAPIQSAPQSGAPKVDDVLYDSTGTELRDDGRPMDLGPADIPLPSFGGYGITGRKGAESTSQSKKAEAKRISKADAAPVVVKELPHGSAVRKSRLPVLEILVIVLLVIGAGAAVWMLHSSLPAKSSPAAPANVVVTISPETARVTAGKAFDFVATVSGANDARVSWTIQEGDEGGRIVTRGAKAEGGKVSSIAVYVAPKTPGTYHLVATSNADPQKAASAAITVVRR